MRSMAIWSRIRSCDCAGTGLAPIRSGRCRQTPSASSMTRWPYSSTMAADRKTANEERDGVSLTNLDQPLFADAKATKRDLVDYLDALSGPVIAALRDRPLSVIRALRGQEPFMQKNLPKYTPDWVNTVTQWAQASGREVKYALCNDRRTLLWFANQRAIEYHPALVRTSRWDRQTHLVMDIDPPASDESFGLAVRAAYLVREALDDAGLAGVVKTSGA